MKKVELIPISKKKLCRQSIFYRVISEPCLSRLIDLQEDGILSSEKSGDRNFCSGIKKARYCDGAAEREYNRLHGLEAPLF